MFECYEFEACEYNAQPKCCLPDGVECPHGVASHEPSDIEKLIEQLKEKDGLWCSIQTGEALIANTITALSTIQAENEKLRAELEQKSKLIAQQAAELERRDKLLKEQETELDQMKRKREELEAALRREQDG